MYSAVSDAKKEFNKPQLLFIIIIIIMYLQGPLD